MKKTFVLLIILLFAVIFHSSVAKDRGMGKVMGKVLDKNTLKPLPSVTVRIVGTKKGAYTNSNGRFSIDNIKPAIYSLQFTTVGYKSYTQSDVVITSGVPKTVNVELQQTSIQLEGAEVKSSYFIKNAEMATSSSRLSAEDVKRAPGVQEDVVRATALLPGVAVTSAGRNDLIVRGGAPFENLFIVDNIEIPNINHFGSQGATGGPLSIINIDFVDKVDFSSGGFGAKFGNKLSSITNIKLRSGNREEYGGKINLSATGFGANFEGPIDESGSFFVSVRRSYLDLIFKAAGFSFIPEYWDFQGKAEYQLDKNNSLSFIAIGAIDEVTLNNKTSDDKYENSRVVTPLQNQYFSGFTWQTLFEDGFARFTLGRNYTNYNTSQKDSNLNQIFKNVSEEGGVCFKSDFDVQLSKKFNLVFGNQTKYGSQMKYDVYIPGFLRTDQNGQPQELEVDEDFNVWTNSTYASVTANLQRHQIALGGRMTYYNFLNKKFHFAPRASYTYIINDISSISASAGRYYQSPSYVWVVGGTDEEDFKAMQADQVVLSYEQRPRTDLQVRVEGYYKWYSQYPGRVYRPQAVLSPAGFTDVSSDIPFGLEPLLFEANGFSRGLELFIQKKLSEIPIYGLTSLTLSETKFESLDDVERTGSFDSRLIFNIAVGYVITSEWEISAKFRASTGLPTTPYLPNGTKDFSRYNDGERLPAFHALDLRLDKRWNFENTALVTYLDIQNLYGQENVSRVTWNQRTQSVEYSKSIGILPSIGVHFEF